MEASSSPFLQRICPPSVLANHVSNPRGSCCYSDMLPDKAICLLLQSLTSTAACFCVTIEKSQWRGESHLTSRLLHILPHFEQNHHQFP